jgi:hypothetical protein
MRCGRSRLETARERNADDLENSMIEAKLESPTGRSPNRREVLGLAAGSLAAAWLGTNRGATAEAVAGPVDDLLSVGFLDGSDLLRRFRPLPWQRRGPRVETLRVVPAERLTYGDPRLVLEWIAMTVHGFHPDPSPRQAPFCQADLTVFFPSTDPLFPEPVPFHAWGSLRRPARSTAAPTRFVVPLRVDGGLELLLEVRDARVAGSRLPLLRTYTDFTVDPEPGRPKLQRGIYLLGLLPDAWRSSAVLPGAGEKADFQRTSLAVSFEPLRAPERKRLLAIEGRP